MTTGGPIVLARWPTRLVILLLLLCGFYGSYRAVHLSLCNDEGGLMDTARTNSCTQIVLGSEKDSNLHFLTTLLAKPCLEFLPLNEITAARVPSLVGLVLFLWGVWRIGLMFPSGATRVLITLALLSNVFLLDFFSLARGYGLAMGFTVLSLSFLMGIALSAGPQHAKYALWTAAIAVLSHAGFVHFFAGIFITTVWLTWRKNIWLHKAATAGLVGAFFFTRFCQTGAKSTMLHYTHIFSDGVAAPTGDFVQDVIGSILRASFYDWHPSNHVIVILSSVLAFLTIVTMCWAFTERIRVVNAVILSTVTSVASSIASVFLVPGVQYPISRAGLYFIPLTILAFGTMATWFKHRWLRFSLWALLMAFNGIGLQGANLSHTFTWRECADIPSALLALREVHQQTGQDVMVAISGSKWTVWYYAEHLLGLHPQPSRGDLPHLRTHDWLTTYQWRVLQGYYGLPPDNPLIPGTTHVLLNLRDPDDKRLLTTPPPGGLTQLHFYPASDTRLEALTMPRYQGTVTHPDGRKYVGEFKHGLANGQGTGTWSDGQKYVGGFEDGRFDGQGTYTWPDGRKYTGEFRDGSPTGQGTATWPDGGEYVGGFRDGQPDGTGKMTYPDGRVEDGLWKQGQFVGTAPH